MNMALPWIETPKELAEVSDTELPAFLAFMLQQPTGWKKAGEPDRYATYLETFLPTLRRHAVQASSTRQNIIDQIILEKLDISLALFGYRNLRTLMRARAELLQDVLARTYPEVPLKLEQAPRLRGKKRLGIVIRYYKPFIDNWMLAGYLAAMPRDQYDITLYSVQDIEGRIDAEVPDIKTFRKEFGTLIDRYIPLDRMSLIETVNRIRQDRNDIIFFGNTAQLSTAKAHLLQAYRLAPVQIITPITTSSSGFDSVNYYLSSATTEPEDAAAHYTEKLILMQGFFYALLFDPAPDQVSQYKESDEDRNWLRAQGLTAATPLLVSGASWPKLTPETITAWAKILSSTPDAHLALYPDSPSWNKDDFVKAQRAIVENTFRQHNIDPKRIHIVKIENHRDILRLLSAATLYLDSFPYSGNMALREPLLMKCPVVACRAPHQRGLQASTVLNGLGLNDCVASNPDSYCDVALKLLSQKAVAHMCQRIETAMRTAPFYDSQTVSRNFVHSLSVIE